MAQTQTALGSRVTEWVRRVRSKRDQVVISPSVSAPDSASATMSMAAEFRQPAPWMGGIRGAISLGKFLLYFAPTVAAVIYYGWIASPRFESEAKFVVRTATKPISGQLGFGAFLQMSGLSRSQDDVFAVHDYMTSRAAVDYLRQRLDLRQIYGPDDSDFLARYPSLLFGSPWDRFHKYFQTMINVSYNSVTGISTLQVQAFTAADAYRVADVLLQASEELINKMNARMQHDAISLAFAEVKRNEQRLLEAQIEITDFRNKELMIDPAGSSVAITELIGRLAGTVAETRTQLRELNMGAPGNPQRLTLERRAEALEAQIQREKERISINEGGLATKLAQYERLVIEREFAKGALTASTAALEVARAEARRQQLYLERIVSPNTPDYPTRPERLRAIATVAGLNILFIMIAWLVATGVREHAQSGP